MKKLEWQKIEKKLHNHKIENLVNLIEELYDLNDSNKRFLQARYFKTKKSKPPLKSYKKVIEEALFPDITYNNDDVNFLKAYKAISDYRVASGDNEGLAELMVFYVETANQFTLNYGDMWEGFYEAIEDMFDESIKHLLKMEKQSQKIEHFKDRLKTVVESTVNIGWGYHDELVDLYSKNFQ